MYGNNIANFQESTTILNACKKTSLETYWMHFVVVWSETLIYRKVRRGFDPGFERPAGLATLKSSDRTKQSVVDDNIYIYIYIYIYTRCDGSIVV